MRKSAATLLLPLLTLTLLSQQAIAEATKASLLEAWEAHVQSLPSTDTLQKTSDGVYRFVDTDLPFDGEMKITGAIVRDADLAGYEMDATHLGMVEFELVGMPVERKSTQIYYYWLSDRQSLHYLKSENRWVDTATYQSSLMEDYDDVGGLGPLHFMLNYGVWIALLALLILVFIAAAKQTRKARALMDDGASINEKARENIERAGAMQDEMLAIVRESRDLHVESNALLKKIHDALSK